jgi:hypothetical protein
MNFTWAALLLTLCLLVGMLVTFEIGRRVGAARLARDPDGLAKGAGAAEGAVFALLGLLMAFTFSGAASRFDERRMLINTEANAIGTAWLRIDLLPDEAQPPMRDLFRRYADLNPPSSPSPPRRATTTRTASGCTSSSPTRHR